MSQKSGSARNPGGSPTARATIFLGEQLADVYHCGAQNWHPPRKVHLGVHFLITNRLRRMSARSHFAPTSDTGGPDTNTRPRHLHPVHGSRCIRTESVARSGLHRLADTDFQDTPLALRPACSPSHLRDPLHRRLRRLCCLHRRSDCYRVERSSSRAGLIPAVDQRIFTAHRNRDVTSIASRASIIRVCACCELWS